MNHLIYFIGISLIGIGIGVEINIFIGYITVGIGCVIYAFFNRRIK